MSIHLKTGWRLTVDSSGNLTVPGTLHGVQSAGSVQVIAGTAFDGTVLPLPPGVSQEKVDSGALAVSIVVTPRLPVVTGAERFIPAQCRVDGDRRLQCWGTLIALPGGTPKDVPGSAEYLVLVSVA